MSGYPDSHLTHHAGRPRFLRTVFVVVVPLLLGGWFYYLWAISGVLPQVDKYADGTVKAEGYVKRVATQDYKRHGHWVTFHPNGVKESDGFYELGRKVGPWHYWDAEGRPLTTAPGSEPADSP